MPQSSLPTDLPRRYRYECRQTLQFGQWQHTFLVIGQYGAVHFHCYPYRNADGDEQWAAGLEFHWRSPPEYLAGPPSYDRCWVLDAPCWHDGTSLYAQETLLPLFLRGDYDELFRSLVRSADERLRPESVS